MRAEAGERRRVEEVAQRRAEEEARRRAEEEAERLAAERARQLAEEEARRRAEAEAQRQADEAARIRAEELAQRQAEEQARLRAEEAERERVEAVARERAQLEARIRAEVEAKLRAEEAERRAAEEAARRPEKEEAIYAEESVLETARSASIEPFEPFEPDELPDVPSAFEPADLNADDDGGEFRAVSVPEDGADEAIPPAIAHKFASSRPSERAGALAEAARSGGEEAFRRVCQAFDDDAPEVRSAAARALFDLQEDRAAAFTRALREAAPDRRRRIGSAIGSSGLANEAIRNLTGESRDKTYDAFSLLFLMSKAGEIQPLMRATEEHPSTEARLAVIKLLALSGQPEVLPAFRRMAVRGSLPAEVRSAVMEAIYQISSQTPETAPAH